MLEFLFCMDHKYKIFSEEFVLRMKILQIFVRVYKTYLIFLFKAEQRRICQIAWKAESNLIYIYIYIYIYTTVHIKVQ